MSNYTITTDFGAKDDLPSGNASKVIKGSEFTTEFTNIKTAVNSKADSDAPTFTGATTFSGTVTLNDDVTFDTNTMFVDVSTNRVGIGTTSPATALDVTGTVTASALDVTGVITTDGLTSSAGIDVTSDLSLADNNKATFGNSDDLQIYHDGSNSYVADEGTGVLNLKGEIIRAGLGNQGYFDFIRSSYTAGSEGLRIGVGSSNQHEIKSLGNRDLVLERNDAEKLRLTSTGIDVTGTVTADGLTVDTDTLHVDATNDRVGIGTNTPSAVLDVVGTKIQLTGANPEIVLNDNTNTNTCIIKNNDGSLDYKADQNNEQGLSRHRFYTDGTQRMEIEANGNVGIGTTSPASKLHLRGSNSGATGVADGTLIVEQGSAPSIQILSANTQTQSIKFGDPEDGDVGKINYSHADNHMALFTNGTERLRIDSSGKVGIGTSSPLGKLEVNGGGTASSGGTLIVRQDGDTYSDGIALTSSDATSHRFWKDSSGKLNIGPSNLPSALVQDLSGNLLVGKTSATATDLGCQIEADGQIKTTSNGQSALTLNRKTSDGSIAIFQKDGSTVGSISVTSSATAYNTSSDERLKENITDSADAGSKVDAIQIRQFDWIADGSHQDYGVIAQELLEVAPEAVSEGETEDDMMSVDYSKLVPTLIKEIQTLRNRVAQLENN